MKTWYKKNMWCGPEIGCAKCRVCKYLDFIEWAEGCKSSDSTITRDRFIEDFLALVDKYK